MWNGGSEKKGKVSFAQFKFSKKLASMLNSNGGHSAIKSKAARRPYRARLTAATHMLRYLRRHPTGLSSESIQGWLKSRKDDYTLAEIDAAFVELRSLGMASCTNGLWWLRTKVPYHV